MRIQFDSVSPDGDIYTTVIEVKDTGLTGTPVVFKNGWRLNVYTDGGPGAKKILGFPVIEQNEDAEARTKESNLTVYQDPILSNTRRIRS